MEFEDGAVRRWLRVQWPFALGIGKVGWNVVSGERTKQQVEVREWRSHPLLVEMIGRVSITVVVERNKGESFRRVEGKETQEDS